MPRESRRRRARLDARPAPRAARRGHPSVSRRSPSRSASRRTTASCPVSSCSPRPTSSRASPSVMVTFDSRLAARLGDLEPPAKAASELVVLDHHVSNERYGTINVIDPDAAASGVLVRRLIDRARPPADARRRRLPLRRARLRHRPVPVRDDHARGLRARGASSSCFGVPIPRALAHAVRGAPVRVPPAARRRAAARGARPRASSSCGPR